MKPFLSIPNWDQLQHYKDRTPPWIKLHNELLESYEFECLPDASKAHLLCIWLLASRTENKINVDPKWIGRKIGANSKVDIDILVESGFLQLNQPLQTLEQDASKALQTVEQDACTEREGEESREEQSKEDKPLPAKANLPFEVFAYWCETMKKASTTKFTKERLKKVNERLKDGYTVDQLKSAIFGCSVTPHNNGTDPKGNGQKYDDLELICRTGTNVERFIGNSNANIRNHDINHIGSNFSEKPEGW